MFLRALDAATLLELIQAMLASFETELVIVNRVESDYKQEIIDDMIVIEDTGVVEEDGEIDISSCHWNVWVVGYTTIAPIAR